MRPSVREGHRRRGDNSVKTRVPTDTCCVHAAAVRSTGSTAAATGGKSRISHAKRKVFGRKTAPPADFSFLQDDYHRNTRPPFTRLQQPSRIACNPSSSRRRLSNYYYSPRRCPYKILHPGGGFIYRITAIISKTNNVFQIKKKTMMYH